MTYDRREGRDSAEAAEVTSVTLTETEYDALKTLVPSDKPRTGTARRQGASWDFIFNVGIDGEIFPYTSTGHTHVTDRSDLRERSPLLATIADAAIAGRDGRGRFFGKRDGVYYKNRAGEPIPCLKFKIIRPPIK